MVKNGKQALLTYFICEDNKSSYHIYIIYHVYI